MSGLIQLVNLVLSLLAFGLIAKWYVLPRLEGLPLAASLRPFLILHSFRHVGLLFLADGAVKASLPGAFARPAAYGDLAASLLAFLSLLALHRGWSVAVPLVWVFNLVGSLDLVNAVARGVAHDAASGMGATFWIPSVVVPALLVTHALMFMLLLQARRAAFYEGDVVKPSSDNAGGD